MEGLVASSRIDACIKFTACELSAILINTSPKDEDIWFVGVQKESVENQLGTMKVLWIRLHCS